LGCEPALLALGFIVGGLFEEYLKRALMLGRGDWMILFNSWISISFVVLAGLVILSRMLVWHKYLRR
jgi:TctA family transporter